MIETIYDRINDYGSVKISLASPNDIRSWSFGEVRKPETIKPSRLEAFRVATRIVLSVLLVWLVFYGVGRILLLLPSEFHEGTAWFNAMGAER